MARANVSSAPKYAEQILLLKDQLRAVKKRSEELSLELENPSSRLRTVFRADSSA